MDGEEEENQIDISERLSPLNMDRNHPMMQIKELSFVLVHNPQVQTTLFHHLNSYQLLKWFFSCIDFLFLSDFGILE